MSCSFPPTTLALHVEGDLTASREAATARHVDGCDECQEFIEELRASQALVKSIRWERVDPADCARMRRRVMEIVSDSAQAGWALRWERAATLAFRRHRYAVASVAFFVVVSFSALAQQRYAAPDLPPSAPTFENRDTLLRPEGYRDWIQVGQPVATRGSNVDAATNASSRGVYIDPSSYRAFARTGRFPEGTLMVWEASGHALPMSKNPHPESPRLLASVKDTTRFDGGWGFFDFTGPSGTTVAKAEPLPESRGCRACHGQNAETDHVFTQFYPVLHTARHRARVFAAISPARGATRSSSVIHATLEVRV